VTIRTDWAGAGSIGPNPSRAIAGLAERVAAEIAAEEGA
jgi:hypothetical protein